MKKLILLIAGILIFSSLVNRVNAQAGCPCPDRFLVSDSGCTSISMIKNGNGYLATDSIRACKGSTFTYTINSSLNGCTYPGIQYTYTVTNGTLISNVGNQFTIQWGNTSPASVTVNFLI